MIKKIRSSKAFTLIEMLIVVAIIGILVGVGVPALRDARADAQARKQETVLANVATAKARYELDNGIAGVATFNAATDTGTAAQGDSSKFDLVNEYLLVNGSPVASIESLTEGTGYTQLTIGDLATYDASGNETAAAESPAFTGTQD